MDGHTHRELLSQSMERGKKALRKEKGKRVLEKIKEKQMTDRERGRKQDRNKDSRTVGFRDADMK
jgi:hypothetical protein